MVKLPVCHLVNSRLYRSTLRPSAWPLWTCHLPRSRNQYSAQTPHDVVHAETASFKELGVRGALVRALITQGIAAPTPVQSEALPLTFARPAQHCIIQAETGTGKTLTFLLPALQDRAPGLGTVILVPTRELAVQMHHQAVALAGQKKDSRRIFTAFSGHNDRQGEILKSNFDEAKPHVLIGTPKKVLELVASNLNLFAAVRRIVLDEVDKILLVSPSHASKRKRIVREVHPRAGGEVVTKILSYLGTRGKTSTPQLICASATVNQRLQHELEEIGWGANPVIVSASDLKSTLPENIIHEYVVCSRPNDDLGRAVSNGAYTVLNNKLDTLIRHFQSSGEKSALVFIHRNASVMNFVEKLCARGISATALYSKMLNHREYPTFVADFGSGKIQMVVGTEETVRGLDFLWLRSVYLLEVPRSAQEYLHLCGRVGRQGRSGRAVVLVEGGAEEKRIVRQYVTLGVQGSEVPAL